jgi:hypothetical protein
MATVSILKTIPQQAVVKVLGSGSATIDLENLKTSNQTFDRGNVRVHINSIAFSVTGTTIITRNSANIFKLTEGQHTFEFSQQGSGTGFVLTEEANANIVVNFGSNDGSVVMTLSKLSGYVDPDQQRFVSAPTN